MATQEKDFRVKKGLYVTEDATIAGDLNVSGDIAGVSSSALKWETPRTVSLTGAVTGSVSIDGSQNVSITTTATSDPTLTLDGDASGSATFTNLGNATLTVTVADDSHNHVISNVDGLQDALDLKAPLANPSFTGNATFGGEIRGPAVFKIDPAAVGDNTGKVVIAGDLQVDGTTTTINSTTLTVNDKQIVIASGAADATAADGAGILIDGANATLTYDSTNDQFQFNKEVYVNGNVGIGTNSPNENLHVSSAGNPIIKLESSSNSKGMRLVGGRNTFDADRLFFDHSTFRILTGVTEIYRISSNTHQFYTNGAEKVRIDPTGNVGIGTSTPDTYGKLAVAGNVVPAGDALHDLGTPTYRWNNVYTTDLHLSNESKPEGNSVDGTTGNWTIQEGADHLYIINNKTNKKYKFALEEIE